MLRFYDPIDDGAVHSLINAFKESGVAIVDTYAEQLFELREIRSPQSVGGEPPQLSGNPRSRYVEYPWRRTAVRILPEDLYREVRTNRNKLLLTEDEQDRFAGARIAFAGLNVGNPGAVCIALEGGARSMKLADPDPLSLSNLNRFRASIVDLGVNKAELTARQILEVDPYYELEIMEQGITPDGIDKFLTEPRVHLLVEEMDALPLKIAVRDAARRHRIPVIMVTGNAEGVILDVERYDTQPDLPLMNDLLPDRVRQAVLSPDIRSLSPFARVQLARAFMGDEFLDKRLRDSFDSFGVSLVGIPQLAESSYLRGAALCFASKAIILGKELPSGRYSFSFSNSISNST